MRTFVAATAMLLTAMAAAAHAHLDDETILEKKESLTDKDKGYKPGSGVDKLADQGAAQLFEQITDNPFKVYKIKLKKGDKLLIQIKSTELDPVVVIEDSKNKVLAFNDDDPNGGTDSRLEWTVPADEEYRIIATCFEKAFGAYELTVVKTK